MEEFLPIIVMGGVLIGLCIPWIEHDFIAPLIRRWKDRRK